MASPFTRRVAGVFGTRIVQFAVGIAIFYVLSALLGPAGIGVYATATLIPGTLYALATFGLPSSLTFHSGRGRDFGSVARIAIVMGLLASVWLVAGAWLLIPWLRTNLVQTVPDAYLRFILIAIPFQLTATLLGSVLYGRQIIRNYNLILIGQSGLMLLLDLLLVGVLHLEVFGALLAFVTSLAAAALLTYAEVWRARHREAAERGRPASYSEVLGYGVRLYPAVVTSFFNYRADVYLLNWLTDSQSLVGLYSRAVTLAEMVFYVPDSVSSIFFPRVASSEPQAAGRMVPDVCRMTLLITLLSAAAILPVAFVGIHLLLPRFVGSLAPMAVLLPAVIAISVAKVLAGYLTGLGHARWVSTAASVSVVVNVAANLFLIPRWGIVGAASASVLSYTLHAAILIVGSVRISGSPTAAFLLPRRADWQRLSGGLLGLLGLLRRRVTT